MICYDADQKGWAGAHKAGKAITKEAAERVRILMWPGCMLEPNTHGISPIGRACPRITARI